MSSNVPLVDWLQEIRAGKDSGRIGMYLMHNGVVRGTTRQGAPVVGMDLVFDEGRLGQVLGDISEMPGIVAVRAWINQGRLAVGDDIMYALVAGDIREHVYEGLQELVRRIKTEVVSERELF